MSYQFSALSRKKINALVELFLHLQGVLQKNISNLKCSYLKKYEKKVWNIFLKYFFDKKRIKLPRQIFMAVTL